MNEFDVKKEVKTIKKLAGNKKIVFVSGNFNILHPGHLRFLRFAKECGDLLVVGVLDDNSPGAYMSENLRLEGVQSISWVDYALVIHESPATIIKKLRPSVIVKGKEHEDMANPEDDAAHSYGGKLIFCSGESHFSSIELIEKEWKRLAVSSINRPIDYPQRHNFDFNDLNSVTDSLKGLNVCIIGDTIIDEYITCDALGISQEDPTIVVTPVQSERFVGGAGIVAMHARGLGAKVHFFSVVGKDEIAQYTKETLKNNGVQTHFFQDGSRPTTLKQRFRARQKALLRVSHLRQHSISIEIRESLFNEFIELIEQFDLIIFSDFNYGCLPQKLVDKISEMALQRGIMMAADSQSSSQIGDISRFKRMNLVTPTEREARPGGPRLRIRAGCSC